MYVESIRGRECTTDLDPLRAHREAQRAKLHEAAGVSRLGNRPEGRPVVSDVAAHDTGNVRPLAAGGGIAVESQACKVPSVPGSWRGSTTTSSTRGRCKIGRAHV